MKKYFTFAIFYFVAKILSCQETASVELDVLTDVQAQIQKIQSKVDDLENNYKKTQQELIDIKLDYSLLQHKIYVIDSSDYWTYFYKISEALDKADRLVLNYEHTDESLKHEIIYTSLMKVQNPTSNVLGLKFSEQIIKISEETLLKDINSQEIKSNWHNIVNRIINIPIVNSALTSTPISSIFYRVVDAATNFTQDTIFSSKTDGNIKNIKDFTFKTESVFNEQKLKDFIVKLAPYIEFYEELNKINISFNESLSFLLNKSKSIEKMRSDYYESFRNILGFNSNDIVAIQMRRLFEQDKIGYESRYREIINKEKITNGMKFIEGFYDLQDEVKNLMKLHYELQNDAYEKYLLILNTTYMNSKFGASAYSIPNLTNLRNLIADQIEANNSKLIDLAKDN